MKKSLILFALVSANAFAALPTLSGLADSLATLTTDLTDLRGRYAAMTNWQASVVASVAEARAEIEALVQVRDALLLVVEADKTMRERFHGGRLGTYILTNEVGRIIRVDLYGDATAWTNGTTSAVYLYPDPEERKKALAEASAKAAEERDRVLAAWEAANLPPDLAALRAAQREIERRNREAEEQ